MSKNFNICCPDCFSKNLYKYGKDKTGKQKYQCKNCQRQFTLNSSTKPKLDYPKCHICGAGTFLHHDYEHYSRFKCNSKKCNHVHVVLKKSIFYESLAHEINSKINIKRLRTNINIVIDALYMYFSSSATTRSIAQYFLQRKYFKISHVAIFKWIRNFGALFKEISEKYMPKDLNSSDEWHVDETVIKISGKRYYIWTLIDSETRFVLDWFLTTSRQAASAFHLFAKTKDKYGSPSKIVSDRLPSYTIPAKVVFDKAEHIKVQSWYDDITNNLIESFFKRFKHKYKTCHGFKSEKSVQSFLQGFFFFYNYIIPHSGLNGETPARVAGVKYTDLQRSNLLLF